MCFNKFYFAKRFVIKKQNYLPQNFKSNQKLFTVKYSSNSSEYFLKNMEKKKILLNFKVKKKVINKQNFSNNIFRKIFFNLNRTNLNKFDKYGLNKLLGNFKINSIYNKQGYDATLNNTSFFSLFDVSFLKKEKMYTKLKYSRVPQYDAVSGASAALLAGFLGFLVCEKFGFELLDSGDFYFLFMYVVFFAFLSRLILKLFNYESEKFFFLSPKFAFNFYKNLLFISISFFKRFV